MSDDTDTPEDIRMRMAECQVRYISALKDWHIKMMEADRASQEVEREYLLMQNLRTRLQYASISLNKIQF